MALNSHQPPDHYHVRLTSTTGDSQSEFVAQEDDNGEDCVLTIHYHAGQITAHASDFFEAMCQIRKQLEVAGWRPVCYGSSLNVYPSGMARDMGSGLKAYRLELGRPATMADLVSIFDTGPDVNPSSVEEQKNFFERWRRSLSR
jgi:hypothetical protein